MQVVRPSSGLLSLLLVFLGENFQSRVGSCTDCGSHVPRTGRVYKINGAWICVDCVINRIHGE